MSFSFPPDYPGLCIVDIKLNALYIYLLNLKSSETGFPISFFQNVEENLMLLQVEN